MKALNIVKETFSKEVLQSDRPVLVDFWASWCGPCRMVLPLVEEIAEEREDIKVCKINVDEQPDLTGRYNVMTIPTLMVFKGGKITAQVSGALPKEKILDLLEA